MSYEKAMEYAGATIHDSKHFGSYQGTFWVHLTFAGKTGFVEGYYGSCSGCDAYQAEFDRSHMHGDDWISEGYSDEEFQDDCAECQSYKKRLKDFGSRYLDEILTKEQAVAKASENLEWDMEAPAMVAWINAHD